MIFRIEGGGIARTLASVDQDNMAAHLLEDNDDVKAIYVGSVDDWSTRKATKIHARVFEDLIQRMPR